MNVKKILFFLNIVKILKGKVYHDIYINEKKYEKKADILFSSPSSAWRESTHVNGKRYKDDVLIGGIVNKTEDEFDRVACIDINAFSINPNVAFEKNSNEKKRWIFLESFMDYKDIILSVYFVLLNKIFDIKIDKKYEKIISRSNREIYFSDILNLIYLNISEKIINILTPKLIVLVGERKRFHENLIYMAKQKKIPVFAVQHGIISSRHNAYILKDKKIRIFLPNLTFVYGKYYKELLTTKSVYNPSEVKVTGSPRYDSLFYADKIYSKKDFKKRYNIPLHNKIVLWTTQCHSRLVDDGENLLNFETVFNAISEMKNITLIVKQHQNEPEKYTQMIKKSQKMFDANILLVPKNSDTFEQLYVSDVMITRDSTTALEAVALDKPVLILNLGNKPDRVDFVKQGVAKGVYKSEDFKPTLEILLKDDSSLKKNREKYIEEYLYKIDGKSSERVVDAVKRVIND